MYLLLTGSTFRAGRLCLHSSERSESVIKHIFRSICTFIRSLLRALPNSGVKLAIEVMYLVF